MVTHADLAPRWPLAGADDLRDALLDAWTAPARGYHDARHLAEVLDHLDALLDALPEAERHRDALVLAAWFHDAVYDADPKAQASDEEASARWATRALPDAGCDAALTAEVARLVRLTEAHRAETGDLAGSLLCDADLAILAAPPDRYADYVAGVRHEYAHVPDADFARGRAAVLRALLDADTLFATAPGRARWEDAARRNATAELRRFDP